MAAGLHGSCPIDAIRSECVRSRAPVSPLACPDEYGARPQVVASLPLAFAVIWSRSVCVSVVNVWIMTMRMDEARMIMPVRVRFADGIVRPVLMLMVFVMHMTMLVLVRLVEMLMIVTLGEM